MRIVGEIADARGYLHRDVNPGDVLFNARSEAILIDFGLAKSVQGSVRARSATMGVIGTAAYIPPEVWRGEGATKASDVYALGCVLYEMLTGKMLFQSDSTPAVMMAHFQPRELHRLGEQTCPPPPPQQWRQGQGGNSPVQESHRLREPSCPPLLGGVGGRLCRPPTPPSVRFPAPRQWGRGQGWGPSA